MRLAEALILRKDLQQRLSMLDSRLSAVARVQEGDQPAENPQQLLSELMDAGTNLSLRAFCG